MTRPEHTSYLSPTSPGAGRTVSRRHALGLLGIGFGATLATTRAAAQESTPEGTPAIESNSVGEMPTTGALRPGPVGQQPPETVSNATIPISIMVETASVDANIEALDIVDGKMQDPTGPWVVAWYRQSAQLGEFGNILLAGHIDYWGVGPSVFYNVGDLVEGDQIDLTGENGEIYAFRVVWNETYAVDELVSGKMAEILAPTDQQVVTLFTCGGEFDYVNGEYLSRTIVRGERLPRPATGTPPA